ncbi:uncharacterized protein LOC106092364 isoform X2 [Stomoxys calcitrans]|uniref:Uncharacterized protein n=1 Tax=Stomoxys calcitrans TaxID=35570 RepID=A0A1I8PYT6_STOCA|nr:uncharacterized protein LOC106092364 isoform X2 [Stomoxys calcitrans]
MKVFIVLFIFIGINLIEAEGDDSNIASQHNIQTQSLPGNIAVDEVVVESSLYIKPKPQPQLRRTRNAVFGEFSNSLLPLVLHRRVKRQFGQTQAVANAAANQNSKTNGGLQSSAANAQAQAFNAQGPSGSFGASSAGTATQSLSINSQGTQNAAGASHSLNFNLPNGQSINFASTNSFANGPAGNMANSRGSAVSVNKV